MGNSKVPAEDTVEVHDSGLGSAEDGGLLCREHHHFWSGWWWSGLSARSFDGGSRAKGRLWAEDGRWLSLELKSRGSDGGGACHWCW